uniref:Uncharacterized protein n=1 Tax=viral metagenome TaxID=1070528 RepID=A0A6C0IXM1_9ZZZZ
MSKKNLKDVVTNFIKYDDYIKNKEKELKLYKQKRKTYSEDLLDFLVKNNNKTLKIGDNYIKCNETNSLSCLSQSFIKNSIEDYFFIHHKEMSKNKVLKLSDDIFTHIMKSRKSTKKFNLKRDIK